LQKTFATENVVTIYQEYLFALKNLNFSKTRSSTFETDVKIQNEQFCLTNPVMGDQKGFSKARFGNMKCSFLVKGLFGKEKCFQKFEVN